MAERLEYTIIDLAMVLGGMAVMIAAAPEVPPTVFFGMVAGRLLADFVLLSEQQPEAKYFYTDKPAIYYNGQKYVAEFNVITKMDAGDVLVDGVSIGGGGRSARFTVESAEPVIRIHLEGWPVAKVNTWMAQMKEAVTVAVNFLRSVPRMTVPREILDMPEMTAANLRAKADALVRLIDAADEQGLFPPVMGLMEQVARIRSNLTSEPPGKQVLDTVIPQPTCEQAKKDYEVQRLKQEFNDLRNEVKRFDAAVAAYNRAVTDFLNAPVYDAGLAAKMASAYASILSVDAQKLTWLDRLAARTDALLAKIKQLGVEKEFPSFGPLEKNLPPTPSQIGRDERTLPRVVRLRDAFEDRKLAVWNKIQDILQYINSFRLKSEAAQRSGLENFRIELRQKRAALLGLWQDCVNMKRKIETIGLAADWVVRVPGG
jgi:hypothetical protein